MHISMSLIYDEWERISFQNLQLGVPQRVVVKDSSPIILARPKSAIFTDNCLSSSKIFSGLISRCTMFRSC